MLSGENPLAPAGNDPNVVKSAADASTICAACGGMVSVSRLDAHLRYWCESLTDGSPKKDEVVDAAMADAGESTLRYLGWLPDRTPSSKQWY